MGSLGWILQGDVPDVLIWQLDMGTGEGEALGRRMSYATVLAIGAGGESFEAVFIAVGIGRKGHILKDQ